LGEPAARLRLDKWLWQARFFKTRSLAAREVSAGNCRVNGIRVTKPAQGVGPGDVLTFVQVRQVRVIRVVALGVRRGPAEEARTLYDDLDPPQLRVPAEPGTPLPEEGGRPTKKDRRAMDRIRDRGALD